MDNMDWLAVISGFGIGAIVGMTGVGGGSLMTPLLISVFKLNPAVAIGTDLWFAAVTKSGGAWAHHRHGHVDYRIAGLMLAGSLPAALATVALMHVTGFSPGWTQALTFSLGIALLLTAVTVAYKHLRPRSRPFDGVAAATAPGAAPARATGACRPR